MASLRAVSRALATSRTLQRRAYATQVSEKLSSDPQVIDYPDINPASYQLRRPKGWDDVQERRNIGETVPEEYEALSMWTPDPPTVATKESALRQVSVAILGFFAFAYGVSLIAAEPPAARRTYPYDGLVAELGGLEQNKARPESIEGDE
ncbi:hypothetical protein FRC03_006642 [Tulasnella sp. 419]|nr:hypothetical protein FRC02_012235 [Tulasnella sp. 418]KAG8970513.1 hypothetical protein FRC03_006642 [Tulasnella sp. 419]